MALVLADRVRETTTTTGTGTVSLAGPVSGFQGFSTAIGNANTTYYTIVDAATGAWEVGLGTYTSSGSTLARTTILSSSNAGSAVNFAAGTKDVFVTQPAERALYLNGAGTGVDAGAAAFTANGVVYASSTSALATGSALTFDGTNLETTGRLILRTTAGPTFAGQIGYSASGGTYIWSKAGSSDNFNLYDGLGNNAYLINGSYSHVWLVSAAEQARLTSSGLEIKQSQLIGYSSYAGIGTNGLAVAGNVGVGLSNPATKLEVVGGIQSKGDALSVTDVNGTNPFFINRENSVTGNLQFRYTTTSLMELTQSGNLGLGVAPSAWVSGKALEFSAGSVFSFSSGAAGEFDIAYNAFFDGAWKYKASSSAVSLYSIQAGVYKWFTAASGTAGNAISFTQAMTLDASGNLGVGTTSTSSRFEVVSGTGAQDVARFRTGDATVANNAGGGFYANSSATAASRYAYLWLDADGANFSGLDYFSIYKAGNSGGVEITNSSNSFMSFGTNNTERARISSDGTFRVTGAGTAGSTDAFQVAGTAPADAARIDSSGNLLVGTTVDAGYKFRVAGGQTQLYVVNAADRCLDAWNSAASGDNEFVNFITEAGATKRGSITYNRGAGLVAYNVTSDYRAKDIIGPVNDSGALIDSVPVYMGKMKGATQERPMFIAHEVPAYAHTGEKDAVDAEGKPVYQQMDASALIPVMWAEIQDLRKRLAAAGI
jgi:hypothetical protein